KQKVDANVELVVDDSEELRKCIEIVLDDGDGVLIKATPISSRYPTIIDYKIHTEEKKNYFRIIRAVGVVRFRKKEKLAPRFIRPFEITEWIGPVAYRLRLLKELNGVHDTFHVSNLKKCLADPTLQVPLDEIQVDAKLNFMEEPVEI
nr:hypothetical protein [Tanacetum cinerariifolium]